MSHHALLLTHSPRVPTTLPRSGVFEPPTAHSTVEAWRLQRGLRELRGAVDAAHFEVLESSV